VSDLATVAPAFVEMAHRIVWASIATVDEPDPPRTPNHHPNRDTEPQQHPASIATGPTPPKRAHLEHSPYVSCSYWAPNHDTCVAECRATWALDDATRIETWARFKDGPEPVGYDPAIVPAWTEPTADTFAVLLLEPWKLRVFPGTVLLGQGGDVLSWTAGTA
jgi:hypothetical protein